MRIVILFSATLIAALVSLAQTGSMPQPLSKPETLPQYQGVSPRASDGIHMWRRAFIRVTPMDLVSQRRANLDSLRSQVARSQIESMKLETRDPLVREQLSKQTQLMDALLSFAEQQDTDQGKSPAALEVQHHLNQIEGQVMCEACHTGINAQLINHP